MWCRPISLEGHIWPTHKHAVVAVKLGATSEIPTFKIFEELTTKTGTNPFQAKSFGKDHTKPNLLQGWHAIHLEAVFKIILSAAFSNAVFLHCLLDPAITAFIHTLPPGREDPFWVQPGENQHGKLLWKACQFVITVATYLKHYLEQPYMVVGVPHVYYGPNICVTDLPDIIAFLVEYQYPPEVEQPEEDDSFIMDFSVAPGDVTAICGVAPRVSVSGCSGSARSQ